VLWKHCKGAYCQYKGGLLDSLYAIILYRETSKIQRFKIIKHIRCVYMCCFYLIRNCIIELVCFLIIRDTL